MKEQYRQSVAGCNRLRQGSEITSQIVGSISRRVSMWSITSELFQDHFVYSFGVARNQKVLPHCTKRPRRNRQKKIKPTSRSGQFHWEGTSDSGAFCKCPGAETQHVFWVTLVGVCSELSALPATPVKAGWWGVPLGNVCVCPAVGVERTVGKRSLSRWLCGSGV